MEYELYHAGVKGMRWGVRRYQNKDGSLTEAGKKRYGAIDRKADKRGWSDDARDAVKIKQKRTSQMSNAEIKKLNERDRLEIERRDLAKKQNRGRRAVKAFIATAGTITAVAAAAAVYKKYGDMALAKIGDLAGAACEVAAKRYL